MGNPDNNWPFPAPMSEERKGQIALAIVKSMNRDGTLADVISNKGIPLSLEEKMEFLEALDSEEQSAQEVLSNVLAPKHEKVQTSETASCRECATNVVPQVMTGVRICPRCKQPILG